MKTAAVYALKAGRQIVKASCGLAYFKSNLSNAGAEARRAARKMVRAAEDFRDEASIAIKRKPLKSVGIAFGLALGVGALAGWLGTRR